MSRQSKKSSFADLLGARDTPAPDAPARATVQGKRSNKDFTQVTAYIRKDTNKRVKATLILDDQAGDFSDLVEYLLQTWLAQRT